MIATESAWLKFVASNGDGIFSIEIDAGESGVKLAFFTLLSA